MSCHLSKLQIIMQCNFIYLKKRINLIMSVSVLSSVVVPIIYQVHRARDGTSFATRKVEAKQKGLVIFTLIASFQVFILLVPSFVNNVQPQENFGILVLIKHLILSMASILGLFGSLPLLALPIFWQWQDLASQKNWWRWLF